MIEEVLPLTPLQEGLLFHALFCCSACRRRRRWRRCPLFPTRS